MIKYQGDDIVKVKEFLQLSRDRITDPGHWTQHVMARNQQGGPEEPRSQQAVSWCAMGAMESIPVPDEYPEKIRYKAHVMLTDVVDDWTRGTVCEGIAVATFNDNSSHARVLEAFDKAIRECVNGVIW